MNKNTSYVTSHLKEAPLDGKLPYQTFLKFNLGIQAYPGNCSYMKV